MCEACDAYDEIMEVLSSFDLTNDQGIQLLANLIITFTGSDPVKALLMLGFLNSRVIEILTPEDETLH